MNSSLLLRLLPFLAVPLLACGDDVYVTPEGSSDQKSAESSQCIVAPGEDVCANLTKYSAETPAPATIDMIRSVVDFMGIAMNSATSLMHACAGILDDLHIQLPRGKTLTSQAGSPDWLADLSTVYCDTAATAIRAQGPGLKIVIGPPVCTTGPASKPACGSGAAPLRENCADPKVTVDPGAGASPERIALAKTLEKNLPAALGLKDDLTQMSSLTSTITGNADSLTTLQPSCTVTFVQIASHATRLITSVSGAATAITSAATEQ